MRPAMDDVCALSISLLNSNADVNLQLLPQATALRATALARQVLPVPVPPENTMFFKFTSGSLPEYFCINS